MTCTFCKEIRIQNEQACRHRTLHACYPPFSILNSNFQCLAYFMNACTGSHRRNWAIDVLKRHQAEINTILLLCSVPIAMEASQACLLLLFVLVVLWYIIALHESKVESKSAPYAFKMPSLSIRCKVGWIDSLLAIPNPRLGSEKF